MMTDRDRIHYETEPQALERDRRADPRLGAMPRQAVPPTGGERLQRRRRTENALHIDPRIVPPGRSYEWKRVELMGKPDGQHMIGLRENHWTPVPADRHPELASVGDSVICRGDVMLMERPSYLTDEARMEDLQEALKPVERMEGVMFGTQQDEMTRDHPSVRRIARVNQRFAPSDPYGSAAPAEGGGGLSSEP